MWRVELFCFVVGVERFLFSGVHFVSLELYSPHCTVAGTSPTFFSGQITICSGQRDAPKAKIFGLVWFGISVLGII